MLILLSIIDKYKNVIELSLAMFIKLHFLN